ncbi:MAG: HAD family hydrolase [Patescibacteria group bacterium]
MISGFNKIAVLIWDFDGTFYKPLPKLWHDVRIAEFRVIMAHTGWDQNKAEIEFEKLYKHRFDSATQTSAFLSNISIAEAAVEMERFFDRRNYLKKDPRLVRLFEKLRHFRHFTLANGVIARHIETFKILGLAPQIFEEMVTSETVGFTKPNPQGFQYILDKTKLPPSSHLMIGDREIVDLVPAKKLGMKTCLVWSDKKSVIADITLKTVYELSSLFT